MSNQTNTFARGYEAFQQGRFEQAYRLLEDCTHPQAPHLLGLAARRLGRLNEALVHLDRARAAEPGNVEVLHNQSLVYLDLGRFDEAVNQLGQVIQQNPDFQAAYRTLGRTLRAAQRWPDAKLFYSAYLNRWPTDRTARYGLGMAQLETGDIEPALAQFEALLAEGSNDSSIHFMRGRAALEAGFEAQAEDSLETAHQLAPSALTLRELGRLYWMQGNREAFAALLRGPFADEQMLTTALTLLRQSGAGAGHLASLIEDAHDPTADQLAVVAQAFVDEDNAASALDYANRSLQNTPVDQVDDDQVDGHRAHHMDRHTTNDAALAAKMSGLLMQGHAEQALSLAREQQQRQPNAQQWIAFESTALRLIGSDEYRSLVNVDDHVQSYELPVPDGFDSLEAFNLELEKSLDRLQLFKQEPVDQSLRGGTQTARDLRTVDDPVIQAYLKALDQPIGEYVQRMGASGSHPMSRRNTGRFRLAGCWSVRLTGGGHHVNHMHPEGWISSAYYVRVPPVEPSEANDHRSGWIHFSQPPFATLPALQPERWIQPKVGMLVLFPSYLWHGTEPVLDNAVRITAPFDVVPQ